MTFVIQGFHWKQKKKQCARSRVDKTKQFNHAVNMHTRYIKLLVVEVLNRKMYGCFV